MSVASATNPAVEQITVGGALISTGSGAPTFASAKGSLFVRTDTGASTTATRLYVNTGGAGNTVWTAITTAA